MRGKIERADGLSERPRLRLHKLDTRPVFAESRTPLFVEIREHKVAPGSRHRALPDAQVVGHLIRRMAGESS